MLVTFSWMKRDGSCDKRRGRWMQQGEHTLEKAGIWSSALALQLLLKFCQGFSENIGRSIQM
jgi:hypothetical protein